jgi:hypothetical protein
MDTIILRSYCGGFATLVASSLDSRSIYGARLSDVEMQELQPRREARASVAVLTEYSIRGGMRSEIK